MLQLARRVARASPILISFQHTSRHYTTSIAYATNLSRHSTAYNRTRTTTAAQLAPTSSSTARTNPRTTPYSYTPARKMSSDADYAAFLDKANEDVAPAEQQDLGKKGYGTKIVNTEVPKALAGVEEYYVSDADEPFEPVALEFSGDSVSAGDMKKLLGQDKVEEVKEKGFETQYKTVFDAVKKAGNGEVKVFRVDLQGTRTEYYVVSIDTEGGKLVGLKALSVES